MKKSSSGGRLEQDEADQVTASTRRGDQAAPATARTSTTTSQRNCIGSTRRQSGDGLSQQPRRSSNHGSTHRRSSHGNSGSRRSSLGSTVAGSTHYSRRTTTSTSNSRHRNSVAAMDTSGDDDINLEKLVAMRHGRSFVRNSQRNSNHNNAGATNNSNHTLSSIVSGSAGEDFENSFAIDDGHAYDATAAVANANANANNSAAAPFQRQLTPTKPGAFHRQGQHVYSRGKGSLTASANTAAANSRQEQQQNDTVGLRASQHDRRNSRPSVNSNDDHDDDDDNSDIGSTTQQQTNGGHNQGALDSSQEEEDEEEESETRPRPPTWIQMTEEDETLSANNTDNAAATASSGQIDTLDLEKMMIARHGTSIVRNSVTAAANISAQVAASLEQPQNNQATTGESGMQVGVEQHPAVGVPVRDGRSSRVSPRDCAVGIVAAQPAVTKASSSTGNATGTKNRSMNKKKKRAIRTTSSSMDVSAKSMDVSAKSNISAKRAALLPLMMEHQENANAEERRRAEQRRLAGMLGDNSGNSNFHDIEEGGDDSMARSRSRQSRQLGDDSSTRNLVRAREVTGESMQDLVLGAATPMNAIGENEENKAGKLAVYLSKRVIIGACLLICVVIIAVVVAVQRGGGTEIVTRTEAPSAQPTTAPTVAATDIVVLDLPESTLKAITMDKTSPQALAYQWLLDDPQWPQYEQGRLLQRFVLATLYFSTNAPTRDQSHWKIDKNWLSLEHHECSWGYRGEKDVIEPCMDLSTQAVSDTIQNILLVNNGLKGTCKYSQEFYCFNCDCCFDCDCCFG